MIFCTKKYYLFVISNIIKILFVIIDSIRLRFGIVTHKIADSNGWELLKQFRQVNPLVPCVAKSAIPLTNFTS